MTTANLFSEIDYYFVFHYAIQQCPQLFGLDSMHVFKKLILERKCASLELWELHTSSIVQGFGSEKVFFVMFAELLLGVNL